MASIRPGALRAQLVPSLRTTGLLLFPRRWQDVYFPESPSLAMRSGGHAVEVRTVSRARDCRDPSQMHIGFHKDQAPKAMARRTRRRRRYATGRTPWTCSVCQLNYPHWSYVSTALADPKDIDPDGKTDSYFYVCSTCETEVKVLTDNDILIEVT